ncbi:MAG: hypothetical protein EBU59_12580, partial [Planctomycetia bacterium]|nr:hypothetical protein [Planctomycetia bacterium]
LQLPLPAHQRTTMTRSSINSTNNTRHPQPDTGHFKISGHSVNAPIGFPDFSNGGGTNTGEATAASNTSITINSNIKKSISGGTRPWQHYFGDFFGRSGKSC